MVWVPCATLGLQNLKVELPDELTTSDSRKPRFAICCAAERQVLVFAPGHDPLAPQQTVSIVACHVVSEMSPVDC